jgi:hypothetical protein
MIRMNARTFGLLAALVILLATAGPRGRAQSPAPSADLSGTWTLDTYLSDSPEQIATAVRLDLGLAAADMSFGRGEGRGSGAARGGRDADRERGSAAARNTPPRSDLSQDEQARIDEVTTLVRYAPATVTVAQTATSVTFTDPRSGPRTFQTSGKREKQTFGSTTVDSTARWEGPQLVIELDLPKDRKMTTNWSIVPTTKQLMMRVTFARGPLEIGPFQIKQVYGRSTP